ncbi:MAG: 4-hydroxy-tetrahydrodipicolinate reductase [Clostridiales bacterium]|nr:4-hydroxy-tetrahydrodipicolinate reductase [Clostridiales bacterium]
MKVGILGKGAMGKALCEIIAWRDDVTLVGCIEPLASKGPEELIKAEVIIDFSHPDNLCKLVEFCKKNCSAAVIATTGYSQAQTEEIKRLGEFVPVVFSANYSRGINVMNHIVADITPVLRDSFDMEIVEKHHNRKLDSPSGTAVALIDAVDRKNEYKKIYGRKGNGRREKEIGIHSIRGGTIAGEHTIIYAGGEEVLEITHRAASKKVFAEGALRAAKFAVQAPAGFYTMDDVLFNSTYMGACIR